MNPERCLSDVSSVLVDGANSVCGLSRSGRWSLSGVVAVALSFVVGVALRRWLRVAPWALAAAFAATAPGWVAIFHDRADAPLRDRVAARTVAASNAVLAVARVGCPRVDVGGCVACEPFGHLGRAGAATGCSPRGGVRFDPRVSVGCVAGRPTRCAAP